MTCENCYNSVSNARNGSSDPPPCPPDLAIQRERNKFARNGSPDPPPCPLDLAIQRERESFMPDLPHPLTFRSEIIQPLADSIRASESCALVGVGSAGKSNIIRFLRDRPEAREKYFGDEARRLLWLMVDCNALDSYDERSLYVAMIDSLSRAVGDRSDMGALSARLEEFYNAAASPEDKAGAFRALSRAVEAVKAAGNFKLAFVLDDCDLLVEQAPLALFRRLRALRDESKYQLVYVTVTRRDLNRLRPFSPEFESFFEIILVRSFAIGPYSEADARYMLMRLAARLPQPRTLTPLEATRLIQATGGHPGLLKAAFYASRAGELANDPDFSAVLINDSSVTDECRKIWESLEDEERAGLGAALQSHAVSGPAQKSLTMKGLVRERTDGSHSIFCPVFEAWAAQKMGLSIPSPAAIARGGLPIVEIFPGVRLVRVDGREVKGLRRVEFELLCALFERQGEACPRDQLLEKAALAESLEPSKLGSSVDEVLDRAMVELRRKIEPPGLPIIVSVAGGGYKLLRG